MGFTSRNRALKVVAMDMPPTVQTIARMLIDEAPNNNGLFRPLGSTYLSVA
jgi:hypothetical protein